MQELNETSTIDYSAPLTQDTFKKTLEKYPIGIAFFKCFAAVHLTCKMPHVGQSSSLSIHDVMSMAIILSWCSPTETELVRRWICQDEVALIMHPHLYAFTYIHALHVSS